MNTISNDNLVEHAIALAAKWQISANKLLNFREERIQKQMKSLLTHPSDKMFLTDMIDQCFRSRNMVRVADQIKHLFKQNGIPDFFSRLDQVLIRLFLSIGHRFPKLTVPVIISKMRKDTSYTIIQGEHQKLLNYLQRKKSQGWRMNLNHLGEAVLGEEEASSRLAGYLEDLKKPQIECISVKISTIYSQVHPLAFRHTINVLLERLSKLYQTAASHFYVDSQGRKLAKFVNLDMEEYSDLEITDSVFRQTLDQPEFKNYSAGIVLQAYLPDSYRIQQNLTAWARKRVASGGSPIQIRLVKGANMEMEIIASALKNWPLATYDRKIDTDANYKRMVDFGMRPENIEAVKLGIASHNLFELAYAYLVAQQNKVADYFIFEMLTGMVDHVCRALRKISGEVLLYAPYTSREHFISAIAYLIRRLDENSAPGNFLRHSFDLVPDSEEWNFLKEQFITACQHKTTVAETPHRTQNRLQESFSAEMGTYFLGEFSNEPDTDWSLKANRQWAESVREKWKKHKDAVPLKIPLVISGHEVSANPASVECYDLSAYKDQICVAQYTLATENDVNQAVSTARQDPDRWRKKSLPERHAILSRTARRLRHQRGDLIGAAAATTGKVFTEADVEVSEAVDFAEYYPFSARTFNLPGQVQSKGKGVGVVLSPWNFPIAIPCGGIVASLAAGNTVIFKPSSEAVPVAWLLCQCFWEAGVSKNTLQFLPCSGSSTGQILISHPEIDYVILTGGTETGLNILQQKPDIYLAAETGGKNATIVTAMSDRDQAIKNIIYSAFGNGGQKCSATSLLILEKEVYYDANFKKQLIDAARSYQTGSVWDFENVMGPLIHPPEGDLLKALTQLEAGESWALQPKNILDNPCIWTPGIKWDVRAGSYTHLTEFFGPLLAVMCADNLDQAVELVNQTGYGLTSGLESLDDREQERWKAGIKAGNLYINRGTTGAITLRQPFGGMGRSAIGAGIKTGGPNYVSQFMEFTEKDFPAVTFLKNDHPLLKLTRNWRKKLENGKLSKHKTDLYQSIRAVESYLSQAEVEFQEEKDYFHLPGQYNIHRYLPVGIIVVRLHPDDTLFETLARISAVQIAGCRLLISIPPGLSNPVVDFLENEEGQELIGQAKILYQTDQELSEIIPRVQRIRYAAPDRVPREVFQAAAKTGFYLARSPVLMEGRIELLHYFLNQSICHNYHRYGNLGRHALVNHNKKEN